MCCESDEVGCSDQLSVTASRSIRGVLFAAEALLCHELSKKEFGNSSSGSNFRKNKVFPTGHCFLLTLNSVHRVQFIFHFSQKVSPSTRQ